MRCIYHIPYILPLFQNFKNSPKIKKQSDRQKKYKPGDIIGYIILDVCMQFENFPIKTIGEEAFYSYYIIYYYLKFRKFAKNPKTV